jgi:hypothetical protein
MHDRSQKSGMLQPNVADIGAHLFALFPPNLVNRSPDAEIEIVYGPPGSLWNSRWFSAFDLKPIAEFVEVRNDCGENCYVGAALRRGPVPEKGRAKSENFLAASCAWIEFDGAGDAERIDAICKTKGLKPAIIVTTGTTPCLRQHIYFKIAGGIGHPGHLKAANNSLRDLLGSDDVTDAIRIMRLAGCINTPTKDKSERGYVRELVTIKVAREPRQYSVDDLLKLRPATGKADRHDRYDFNNAKRQSSLGFKFAKTDDDIWDLLQASRVPHCWHNSIRDAIAAMVWRGWTRDAIRFSCASYCDGGKDDCDLDPLIEGAFRRFGGDTTTANPSGGQAQPATITTTPYTWTEPNTIPQRDWLYDRRLIRKFATATVAPGGLGKSSLEIVEGLAMVSGRALLGVSPPTRQLRVWLWNLEDPREETTRRIQATAKHYRLTPDDLGDRLFVDCGREQPLVIAETMQRTGAVICRPVVDSLIAKIREFAIDVVIIDPFVSSHRVAENDNSAIDMIVKEWARVADLGNCAIELVHHVRKGEQEITVESARGGGSFGDACRMVRVLNRMTKEDAEKAAVKKSHRLYFRAYIDKNNLAPPAEASDWFEIVSVSLDNNSIGVGGDSVGVVTRWQWPDFLSGVTAEDFVTVAAVIKTGNWRADIQSKNWVGRAVARGLELDLDDKQTGKQAKERVKALLRYWIGAGSLMVVEGETPKREKKQFVVVNEITE